MRTLQERLTFDSGLTIGTHAVLFIRNGQERKALVKIGRKGSFPRVTLAETKYLTTYQVRGDVFIPEGCQALYVYADQFNAATEKPVATVEMS